jgi:magnesium and cobalt transporter
LVTIEDILERIVGEIEDEHDKDDDDILQVTDTVARVKGTAGIDDFNRHFNVNLKNKRFTTIGGWLANRMGGVPKKGETLSAYGITFTITEADSRRARAVQVVIKKSPPADGGDTEEGEEEEEDKKTNAPAQEAAEKNA